MTRTLTLWIKAWSSGNQINGINLVHSTSSVRVESSMSSPIQFDQNQKNIPRGTRNYIHNDMKNVMKKGMKMKETKRKKTGICVTRAPERDQFTALSNYGFQLLDNSQPDYAVAYLRTLRRLFNEMYLHGEDEEEEDEEQNEEDDRSESTAGNIPSLWKEFGNILENVIQERSLELYGAKLDF